MVNPAGTDSSRSGPGTTWLMDGSIYFFRGYFGIPADLVDRRGHSVNGVLGFAQALVRILRDHPARGGAVTFDESLGSGFRHALFPAYKANRAPPDDDVKRQFRACRALCETLGVPGWASRQFEADDLLATLAARSRSPTIIYSKDKDLHQLINKKVHIQDTPSGDRWNLTRVQEQYGFAASLLPDYQALMGDVSDNVPGIPGVGAKTAGRLVARYGGLERVLGSVALWDQHRIGLPSTGRVANALEQFGERALLMRELVRLVSSAPLPRNATKRTQIDTGGLTRWLTRTGLEQRLRSAIERALAEPST